MDGPGVASVGLGRYSEPGLIVVGLGLSRSGLAAAAAGAGLSGPEPGFTTGGLGGHEQ